MCKTIAISVRKGGTGKTAVTINLGASLAKKGYRVLLVDTDGQGHLSEGIGLRDFYDKKGSSIFDKVLTKQGKTVDLIQKVEREGFWAIPSERRMKGLHEDLIKVRNREQRLLQALREVYEFFDFILIDCPPSEDILTDNALVASDGVIMPIEPHMSSIRSLELSIDHIQRLEEDMEISIEIVAVVPNKVTDSNESLNIRQDLRANVPTTTPFDIRKRDVISFAWTQGRSIFEYQTKSWSQKRAQKEAMNYFDQLSKLVIGKMQ